jgi:hypothetical protein
MSRLLTALVIIGLLLPSMPAYAANVNAKITVVQVTGSGTRFFMQPQNLSLFASSAEHRAVLLEAFFRKATVSVGYTPISCPGGITTTCGTVTFVSVSATAIP